MNGWRLKTACTFVALGVALYLQTARPAQNKAVAFVTTAQTAEPSPQAPARPHEIGEGAFRFEVEPDDVEIYLDDHYLGRAGELRGRALQGILAGNRLLELRGYHTIKLTFLPPVICSAHGAQGCG